MQYALAYARAGFKVFPVWGTTDDGRCACGDPHDGTRHDTCLPNNVGKHPISEVAPNGFKSAGDDPAYITLVFGPRPTCNIGLQLAAVDRPGGWILVDADGDDEWHRLERVGLWRERTTIVRTGRPEGGAHIYFRRPAACRAKDHEIVDVIKQRSGDGRGLCVRSLDGYALGVGSRHASGRFYRFDFGTTLADAIEFPADILADISAVSARPRPSAITCTPVGEGQRHDTLKSVVASLIAKHPPEIAAALAHAYNARWMVPPKPDAELDDMLAWTLGRETAKPASDRPNWLTRSASRAAEYLR